MNSSEPVSAAQRDRTRNRQFLLNSGLSALTKVVSVGTGLVTVPLTLQYLGSERYGMWMTMVSFVAFLAFADLGIGNGLLSSVATAHGREDRRAIRVQVSSAYCVLSIIALSMTALLALIYSRIEWHLLFNVQSDLARAEAGPAVAALMLCFAAGVPIGIVQRTQMGLQRGYLVSLWQCAGSLTALLAVLVAIEFEASLTILVLAISGVPLLVGLVNGVVFFSWIAPDIRPTWKDISGTAIRALLGTGLLFLVLQLAAAVTYLSDNFIIAQKLGAAAVPDYAVPEKLFSLVSMTIALALTPLWPAYGEAIARGDSGWVRHTLRRSLTIAALTAGICSLGLILGATPILGLWVGEHIAPPFTLLVALAVWKVVESTGLALAMFLNGARVIGFQVKIAISTAAVSVALKIYLIDVLGLAGVVWATAASFLLLTLLPIYWFRFSLIDRFVRKIP